MLCIFLLAILLQIVEYVLGKTEEATVPLLVVGGAGSGKTSILAKAVNCLEEKQAAGEMSG